MERGVARRLKGMVKGVTFASALVLTTLFQPLMANGQDSKIKENVGDWKEFHSVSGNCTMTFPAHPEHVAEKMSISEEGYELKYDAYISSVNKDSVFMLLVAQYPEFVDETYASSSLESFLNGILTHNPNNQLIFADLVLVNGHEALDFFIRTGSVYFKGRAMMVKNSLYLMAMECEMRSYNETHYNKFVNSFQFAN